MSTFLKMTWLVFMFSLSFNSYAVVSVPKVTVADIKVKKESVFTQLSMEEIFTMSRTDIETKVGRKLKLKERLGLKILQKAAKKMEKHGKKKGTEAMANENLFGILSISFGSVGLLTAVMGVGILFGIAAIVLGVISRKRAEPRRKLRNLGVFFGVMATLGVIIFFLAIIS